MRIESALPKAGITWRVETAVSYQPVGPRVKARRAFFDISVVPDPRAWLEARLGPLAAFKIEGAGAASPKQLDAYQQAANTMRRLLTTLGLQRRAREVPTLGEHLASKANGDDVLIDVDGEADE